MKRILTRLTALVLAAVFLPALLTTGTEAEEKGGGYADVPQWHWAAQSVARCTQAGLMQGIGGGAFGLGQAMTRAQYAMALCRLMEWEMVTPEAGSFADNREKNRWYYSAIETAYANGALVDESAYCRPTDAITREEMAKMTIRALGCGMLAGSAAERCPFTDVSVARGYIALAYEMGLLRGVKETVFSPGEVATREQAAAVLERTYERLHTQTETVKTDLVPEEAIWVEGVVGEGKVPVSPRAPLANVYAAARNATGGAVALQTAPLEQITRDGKVTRERTLTQSELAEFLSDERTLMHHSAQHSSSCAYRTEEDGSVVTVWYESEDDLAAKTALCRLAGVQTVYITGAKK